MSHTLILHPDKSGASSRNDAVEDPHAYLFRKPREAYDELMRRRGDLSLRAQHRAFLLQLPRALRKKLSVPRAVLFRQVGTPTHETLEFLRIAESLKLKPLILEFHDDKFVGANNSYKRALGKLMVYCGKNRRGEEILRSHTVLDFVKYDGHPLKDVELFSGKRLVDVHHHLLRKVTGLNPSTHCLDGSEWFADAARHDQHYYERVFGLFLSDAILFENFHTSQHERELVKRVILPSFKKTFDEFGVTPLIVRLLPRDSERASYWDSYPKAVEKYVVAHVSESHRKSRSLVSRILRYARR